MRLVLCAALAGAILTTAAKEAGVPHHGITPLPMADVDFYLHSPRAAAVHNSHLVMFGGQ